jgi:hypothetical protein
MAKTAKFSVGEQVTYQIDGATYTVEAVHNDPNSQSPATYDITSGSKHLSGVPEAALSTPPAGA